MVTLREVLALWVDESLKKKWRSLLKPLGSTRLSTREITWDSTLDMRVSSQDSNSVHSRYAS